MQKHHFQIQQALENLIKGHIKTTSETHEAMSSFMHEEAKNQEIINLKSLIFHLTQEVNNIRGILGSTNYESFHSSLRGLDGAPGKSINHDQAVSDVLARMPKQKNIDIESIISAVMRRMPKPLKEGPKLPASDELNKQITSLANEVAILKSKSFAIIPPKRFGGGGGSGATFQPWTDLAGAVNGINTVFTLSSTYPNVSDGTETIVLNGLVQLRGSGNDYTISLTPNTATVATVTFASAPAANKQSPRITYQRG